MSWTTWRAFQMVILQSSREWNEETVNPWLLGSCGAMECSRTQLIERGCHDEWFKSRVFWCGGLTLHQFLNLSRIPSDSPDKDFLMSGKVECTFFTWCGRPFFLLIRCGWCGITYGTMFS
jgi:hypothetical protein